MRMFDTSNDSRLFLSADQIDQDDPIRHVPLYEGNMLHLYDHRWGTYSGSDDEGLDVSMDEKKDPSYEPIPRYFVADKEIARRLEEKSWPYAWLMGWRRISGVEKIRTVIASVLPLRAVSDSIFLLFANPDISAQLNAALLANLSSLTLDYVARTKMGGTNLSYYILEQLPVLPPDAYNSDARAYLVPRVLELTYTSHSMATFARDLGYERAPFTWDEERRALIRAELDAWFARAYGLTRDEFRFILDPADVMGGLSF